MPSGQAIFLQASIEKFLNIQIGSARRNVGVEGHE
jgi:hypothetical protein